MSDCKCLTVKFYDDDGWRCMQCYREFLPRRQLKELAENYFLNGKDLQADMPDNTWWRMPTERVFTRTEIEQAMNAMWDSLVEKHGTG